MAEITGEVRADVLAKARERLADPAAMSEPSVTEPNGVIFVDERDPHFLLTWSNEVARSWLEEQLQPLPLKLLIFGYACHKFFVDSLLEDAILAGFVVTPHPGP